ARGPSAAGPRPAEPDTEKPRQVPIHRQARQAARHAGEDHGSRHLRHRRPGPGDARRLDRALPGLRRQGQELRRDGRDAGEGREARRPGVERHRRGGGRLLDGAPGPAGAQGDVGRGTHGPGVEHDFIVDAVETSKAVGAPVKVMWTREDDITHGFYRPATYNLFRATLDARGVPAAWFTRMVGPGILIQKGRAQAGTIDAAAVEA